MYHPLNFSGISILMKLEEVLKIAHSQGFDYVITFKDKNSDRIIQALFLNVMNDKVFNVIANADKFVDVDVYAIAPTPDPRPFEWKQIDNFYYAKINVFDIPLMFVDYKYDNFTKTTYRGYV